MATMAQASFMKESEDLAAKNTNRTWEEFENT